MKEDLIELTEEFSKLLARKDLLEREDAVAASLLPRVESPVEAVELARKLLAYNSAEIAGITSRLHKLKDEAYSLAIGRLNLTSPSH